MRPECDGPLAGGTANRGRVIRVGETVHRPRGAFTPAVHALLEHLADSGFDGAPRVVVSGDNARSEVLDYIEGSAATEPLAEWALTDYAIRSVGRLLRDYHRHASGFDARGRRWQRQVPEPWRGELVTHNDVNPANVIFRRGTAVALIDFDLAAPGTPAWDLAVTACLWIPVRDPRDISDRRRERRGARLRSLLEGYGAGPPLGLQVVQALTAANHWIAAVIEDAARTGHPAFGSHWERDIGMYRRAATWLDANLQELAEGVH